MNHILVTTNVVQLCASFVEYVTEIISSVITITDDLEKKLLPGLGINTGNEKFQKYSKTLISEVIRISEVNRKMYDNFSNKMQNEISILKKLDPSKEEEFVTAVKSITTVVEKLNSEFNKCLLTDNAYKDKVQELLLELRTNTENLASSLS